jgi:cysteine desulfurase/selenocysteine lyase
MKPSESDVERWRREFPILDHRAHAHPLIYLDNGATTQKPRCVIQAVERFYRSQNANIHRGVYALSQGATEAYEQARQKVKQFIHARNASEIIFTRGTTESINLVAAAYGRANLKSGDEIVLSAMEHHSNIVPWQMIAEQTGAALRVIPIDQRGELVFSEYEKLLSDRTKIVTIVHVSNSLGTVNPVDRMIQLAHARGAVVLVDGAQWVSHFPLNVQTLDADFYAFSGHKLYGPTGIGVLYGKQALLEAMPPYQGGGDMIRNVSFAKTEYAEPPSKFEAGTPHIAGAIGLAAAIDFVSSIGHSLITAHEHDLLKYATEKMTAIAGVRIVGTAAQKAGVISFVIDDPPISSLDLGMKLDAQGIAVRTGHHCCQPVMDHYHIAGTARASFALYNTRADVDAFVSALSGIIRDTRPQAVAPAVGDTELKFPEPSAASPSAAAEELAGDFEVLGERDARTQYIVEMGERIPAMPALLKTESTRVHGCMSVVHLFGRPRPGGEDRLDFVADSDAHIVRGLIAILQRLFAGQPAGEILAFDVDSYFNRIGLDQFISTQRRNGLAGMVKRIRALAEKIAAHQPVA